MAEGVDYSWARPGAAAIKGAGKTFIMRYLYPDGQGGKGLDADEVADALAHGLLIGTVFESSGGRALAGYAAGVADATIAASQLAALGMSGNVVYFAVDFDAQPNQYEAIGQYLDGAASVRGKSKTGLYAGFGPIDALCGGARADYGWQTYGWSIRNHVSVVSANANVYQYLNGQTLNGGSVDLCRNLKDDFGAFGGTTLASLDSTRLAATPPIIAIKHSGDRIMTTINCTDISTMGGATPGNAFVTYGPGFVSVTHDQDTVNLNIQNQGIAITPSTDWSTIPKVSSGNLAKLLHAFAGLILPSSAAGVDFTSLVDGFVWTS